MQRIDREKSLDVVPGDRVILEATDHPLSGVISPELDLTLPTAPASSGYSGRPIIPGLAAIALRVRVGMNSGMAPLPVHATALDCAWTGPTTGNPYEDLEFTWDFGDPGTSRTMTNPTTGAAVSTNFSQVGPEAVHLYETPGEYTITLTARGWNGTEFITATTSTVVQAATARVEVFNATTGTYTLRVQEARHARAARCDSNRGLFLIRPAGHAVAPGAAGFFFSAWYRLRATGSTNVVASHYANTNGKRGWQVYVAGAGAVTLQVGDSASGVISSVTAASYNDTNWHHVAAWCDTATGDVRLVVDGVAGSLGARTPGLAMRAPGDVPFALGANFGSTLAVATKGNIDIDEAAYWSRPTTSDERTWLYNGGAGRHWDDIAASSPPAGLTTGLLAWWTFDEKRGPTWADSTGNGHALQDYGVAKQYAGVAGVTPKCYRPGGVETAPLAHDADIHAIRAAVAKAAGLDASDVYDDQLHRMVFGGAAAGQAWTLVPGTLAGGFTGRVDCLGHEDADAGPGITVTEWDTARCPTVYFDSNAASDGDGTESSPYKTSATLSSLLSNRYPNAAVKPLRFRLRAGSDFALAARMNTWCLSPTLIQKWGDGADPILRNPNPGSTEDGLGVLQLNGDAGFAADRFLMDRVTLISEGTVFITTVGQPTTEVPPHASGIHLLGVNVATSYAESSKVILGSQSVDNVGFWGGSISGGGGQPPGSTKTSGLDRCQNLGFDSGSFGSLVGVGVSGGGCVSGSNGNTFAHHVYWGVGGNATLARWVDCGPTAPYPEPDASGYTHHEMNLGFKGSVQGGLDEAPRLRRGFVVDSCDITGTQNGAGFGRQNTSSNRDGNAFDRLVLSNNRCHKSTIAGNQYLGIFVTDASSATFRDNTLWKNQGISIQPNSETYLGRFRVHRNRVHAGADLMIGTSNAAYPQAFEFRSLLGLEMTDNVAVFRGANSVSGNRRGVVRIKSRATLDALDECLIDRNQYFAPDVADGAMFAEREPTQTSLTIADWQLEGYDLNAVVGDPGWLSPSTGDFSTATVSTTAYTLTGPTSIRVGEARTYTLTPNGDASGVSVAVGMSGVNDQAVPPTVVFTGADPITFQYTAMSAGTATISATNSGGLINPAPLVITVDPKKSTRPPRITPSQLHRPNIVKWKRSGRYPG